ncbi:MAG TPA: hypothetical protein VG733_20325 [Chthoniobacteraceae bacterium]|nr:hypothetical protein [Chthoniobacteraceae bacterium]
MKPLFDTLLNLALWLAGIGHFCILIASFQMPFRLGWPEDLAKLREFNRKIIWVSGAFIVLTIIAFGTLTLALHEELMRGDRAALGLAAFIAVFWTFRVLVDFFYFKHAGWPKGPQFVLGHILLTALFIALAGTYWAALLRHLLPT